MYTVRLKLELSQSEEYFMKKCFFFMNTIHNRIVSHAQNCINAMFRDADYMSARKEYGESEFARRRLVSCLRHRRNARNSFPN